MKKNAKYTLKRTIVLNPFLVCKIKKETHQYNTSNNHNNSYKKDIMIVASFVGFLNHILYACRFIREKYIRKCFECISVKCTRVCVCVKVYFCERLLTVPMVPFIISISLPLTIQQYINNLILGNETFPSVHRMGWISPPYEEAASGWKRQTQTWDTTIIACYTSP